MFLMCLGIIFALLIVNSVFLSIYCRAQEKLDIRQEIKKQKLYTDNIVNKMGNAKSSYKTEVTVNSTKLKRIIAKLYSHINPYAYGWTIYCIILTGKIPSGRCRNIIYRYIFNMKITKNTVIYGGCEIRSPWNIKADKCVISTYCILDGRRGITIGNNVVFGSGVHIWTEEHDVNDPYFAVNFNNAQPVVIENRAWICSDSTILPGTHIGEGAVVAARAVITKDCEAYSVYGGVPAKKISLRNHNLVYELSGKTIWHFYY